MAKRWKRTYNSIIDPRILKGRRRTKHTQHGIEGTILIPSLSGGLDLSIPPEELETKFSPLSYNTYFHPDNNRLQSRPGLKKYSNSAAATQKVWAVIEYNDGTNDWVCFLSNGKLYALDGSKDPVEKGAMNANQEGVLTVFHGGASAILLAADGGGYIKTWDGSSLGTINSTGAPANVLDVTSVSARIVAIGDSTNPNRVFIGSPGDSSADTFDSSGQNGQFIDVRGKCWALARWKDQVIVFTTNPRSFVKLNMTGAEASSWVATDSVEETATTTSATNKNAATEVLQELFFIDMDGLKAVSAIETYGDLGISPAGQRVDADMIVDATDSRVMHHPKHQQLICKASNDDKLYVFHYIRGVWTKWWMAGSLRIWSMDYISHIDKTLFGAQDGFLYEQDATIGSDNGTNFATKITSKIVIPRSPNAPDDEFNRWLMKELILDYDLLVAGNFTLQVLVSQGATTITCSGPVAMDSGGSKKIRSIRAPGTDFQFSVTTAGGGCLKWNRLTARVALVGRT